MPNQYHPGFHNHENFSYGNTKNMLQPPPRFYQIMVKKKLSLEDLSTTYIIEPRSQFNKNEARMNNMETYMVNMGATMKSLEMRVSQSATSIYSLQRENFPGDTK